MSKPLVLSVVVVVFEMRREAARTLRSLAAAGQPEMDPAAYEVLVVENGSTRPLDPAAVRALGPQFRYLPFAGANASPAGAVNFGLREARGAFAAVMIDGARLASPGLLAAAAAAAGLHPRTIVATTSWHLGPDSQQQSILQGYTAAVEDAALAAIGWPEGEGHRLFEIASPAHSARDGIFRLPYESNFLGAPTAVLREELGGCDERFDLPGGGLVNHDLFRRACDLPETEVVLLVGEATFHQLHGGISTNPVAAPRDLGARWQRQYLDLRGRAFTKSPRPPRLFGHVPASLARAAEWSAQVAGAADATAIQNANRQYAAARDEHQRRLIDQAQTT